MSEQSVRAQIYLEDGREYYGLPDDFGGFRTSSLWRRVAPTSVTQRAPRSVVDMTYINPSMNGLERKGAETTIIVGNQISPPANGDVLRSCTQFRLMMTREQLALDKNRNIHIRTLR